LRRHPHVFGEAGALPVSAVNELWEQIKAREKETRAERRKRVGMDRADTLAAVPTGLPALARALKLQQKAAAVGFDWNDPHALLAKIREEANEIESALVQGERDRLAGEIGDLLFAVVNLARHFDADPETALRSTNAKFERRFAAIERALADIGKSPRQSTLTEMDALWDAAKAAERKEHED